MPKTKKQAEHIPTLIDNDLHNLIVRLQATKTAIKSLETKKDNITDEVKSKVADGGSDGQDKITVRSEGTFETNVPTYTVSLSDGSRATIDRDLLLSRGVSPEIIAACTKKSEYSTLRIKENKAVKDD